jgi:hypothetical protein
MPVKTFKYYLNIVSNLTIVLFVMVGLLCTRIGFAYFNEKLLWSYFVVALPLVCLLAGIALFFVNAEKRINISMSIFFTTGTLLVMDSILGKIEYPDSVAVGSESFIEQAEQKMGKEWDYRDKFEVVFDLRKRGEQADPVVMPRFLLKDSRSSHKHFKELQSRKISPLGGMSKAQMVMCNESGEWISFKSDRFGFNNDDSVYEDISGDRIILMGDSFTHGFCVEPEDNLAGHLKGKGYNVINLGQGGNGPLTVLATLKEYAIHFEPKYIFWIFHNSDLDDLRHEYEDVFLTKYLDRKYSQSLVNRQQEIDTFWKEYLAQEEGIAKKMNLQNRVNSKKSSALADDLLYELRSIITFGNIRRRLGFIRKSHVDVEPIFRHAKATAEAHGIKLYLVLISSFHKSSAFTFSRDKDLITEITQKLDIPVIDFEKHVKKGSKDYWSIFPFRRGAHYSREGYSLLAEAIAKDVFE